MKIQTATVLKIVQKRIPQEERDPAKHYYDIRHSPDDWSTPSTIEPFVMVDWWGTIITNKPLAMEHVTELDKGYIDVDAKLLKGIYRITGKEYL